MEKDDVNYIICPDTECDLFYDKTRSIPCVRDCPHGDKMNIMIKCLGCGIDIVLKHRHCSFLRVDCKCGACNFHRMSGHYKLVR